jgi:hypothetical protein
MELYEDRIINGLLKANTVVAPREATQLLAREVVILAPENRATEGDLWPAIWSLAAALERQFSGTIHIIAGLSHPLPQPARLTSRVSFGTEARPNAIRIHLGLPHLSTDGSLCGDARGGAISYGSLIDSSAPASPLASFALSGYLAFAAMALATGIPPYRREFTIPLLEFEGFQSLETTWLNFVGLGHLGQAYLALLFFLARRHRELPKVCLVDKGRFELPNWSTQILIELNSRWMGAHKAEYLRQRLESWGWQVEPNVIEINWGWRPTRSGVGILGLDKFEVRRMAIAGGYSWIFDAGLGDSFLAPRISWHSIPADNALARRLFPDDNATRPVREAATSFLAELQNTPGACGLLIYEQTQASAPCLGLVASAFLWSEVARHFSGVQERVQGSATLWSPILPPLRSILPDVPSSAIS